MFTDVFIVCVFIVLDEAADNKFDHIKSPSFLITSIIAEISRDTRYNEKENENNWIAKKS